MNNEQLLLAVSDMMEQKLLAVSDMMEQKLLAVSDVMEQKLLDMSNVMEQKLDEKLEPVYDRLDRIENRLDKVENRLDKVESEISALKCGQREIREELRKLNTKVNETYEIALDAFGTSTENRHWLEKSKLPM